MRTVITYGTFDLFHIGHVRLLERARALGNRLIVGVSTDEFNAQKGKTACMSYENRVEVVKACRYVDLVIPESQWRQKEDDILKYNAQIFAMGDDWTGKFDHLSGLCDVHYFSRTPDISTTLLKQTVVGKTSRGDYPSLVASVVVTEMAGERSE